MEWYYSNNGQQAGPVSQDQLAELYRNGTVKPFDLVWNETMTEWTPIGSVGEFDAYAPAPPMAAAPAPSEAPPTLSAAPPLAAAPAYASYAAGGGNPEPPTYLWQAIVVTVLCCLPFGIAAIVFSTKVKPAYLAGDYAASLEASKKAKMWCIVALIVGLITNILLFALQIVAAVGSAAANQSYQ